MKKLFLAILIIVSLLYFVLTGMPSYALDEEGCLTCHQYPGLVRREEGLEGLRVLHIDEGSFFASKHGKVSCRKCHKAVTKVPHTGQTSIDCTTECHLSDKEKKMVNESPLSGFHKKEQAFITHLEDESSCSVCHSLYPHKENNVVRALLNMHTGFMFCETCHTKKGQSGDLSYGWRDTENVTFQGKPFGSYYNPHTRETQKNENFISRIAVFRNQGGEKRLITGPREIRKAKKLLMNERDLKPQEREKELNYFHRDVEKKEISIACEGCHSSKSILDFRGLGFSERKTKNLILLNIKGLVTKYKTFYFPNLFGDQK